MAPNTTTRPVKNHTETNRNGVRPAYIDLGTDAEHATHTYDTRRECVHVVQDGSHDVVDLSGRSLDAWMDYTRRERGWAREQYGRDLIDVLADALEVSA